MLTERLARCRSMVPLVLASFLATASTSRAQPPSPHGSEFQVNTYTFSMQGWSRTAVRADGSFVITWGSVGSSGSDSDTTSVHFQRFSATGSPLGNQFQANTYTTSEQLGYAVAIGAAGQFVVVWQSRGSEQGDSDGNSIQARIFSADGTPLAPEFQVNTYTASEQFRPDVAWDSAEGFVVVWASAGSASTDSSGTSVQLQRFSASGTPIGGEFQVNTYTTGNQLGPKVAAGGNGAFVVVWQSDGGLTSDTSGYSIRARPRFTDGNWGAAVQVNTYTTDNQVSPAVAADAQGNFVVVWQSNGSSGSDSSGWSVQAQRFQIDATPIDGESQVNTYTTSSQRDPSIASDSRGNFVVAWDSYGSTGSDHVSDSVQARQFRADGSPASSEFQVNTYTTSIQNRPAVASNASGGFVVTWESAGSSGSDNSDRSIQAQRYDGLFSDGFESGGTIRWSLTAP